MQIDQIIETLESLSPNELMRVNNRYCDENRCNDIIYYNNSQELNSLLGSPDAALRAASYGNYNYSHNYFRINGYGNLESFKSVELDNLVDTPAKIAEHILENPELYNLDIFGENED